MAAGSADGAAAAYEEAEENPFKLPAESEITTYRDRERAEKSAERQRQKQLRVYEKLGNRMRRLRVKNTTTLAEAEAAAGGEGIGSGADLHAAGAPANQKAHDLAIQTRDRHIEKEQLQDYIEKKREMFLVQYALEVKKTMMAKLAQETETEEKKLDSAEQQLEADAAKFDQFLKDNDRNSAAAIKEAEEQTMLKSEKTSEIKALQASVKVAPPRDHTLPEWVPEGRPMAAVCVRARVFACVRGGVAAAVVVVVGCVGCGGGGGGSGGGVVMEDRGPASARWRRRPSGVC